MGRAVNQKLRRYEVLSFVVNTEHNNKKRLLPVYTSDFRATVWHYTWCCIFVKTDQIVLGPLSPRLL